MRSITLPMAPPSTRASPAASRPWRLAGQSAQPHRDPDAHTDRQPDEQPSLPSRGRGEKAEGRADIVHAGDVENRQYADELEFAEMLRDVALAELIRDAR